MRTATYNQVEKRVATPINSQTENKQPFVFTPDFEGETIPQRLRAIDKVIRYLKRAEKKNPSLKRLKEVAIDMYNELYLYRIDRSVQDYKEGKCKEIAIEDLWKSEN
ncbi:MAG: hypothetical protein LBR36_04035 [Bacteroidales bacterium]|jgi:hypothetical protein|nr:hypothetical protein [Bacteroidales bacterium]